MPSRLELHDILKELLGADNVYYQAPNNLQIKYPCILYKRDDDNVKYASNIKYLRKRKYTITVIDKLPDSKIGEKINKLIFCSFDKAYTVDNLNHEVYTLYY